VPFPNNLPPELTSFVGRRREMAEIRHLLANPANRLLTLTGTGGCGKTRLALRIASHSLKEYLDGTWFVDLASLADPMLMPQAVASSLGVKERPGRSITGTLVDYLKPRRLLLILDNCEHLVEACASLVGTLLHDCANLRVLATSRQPLGVTEETVWPVPSLSLPDPALLPPLKELGQYDAVRLFARRAQFRRENFEITSGNAAPVAQLCCQLDGIPLAIELAAGRMSVLSVEEIVERLQERFRLLISDKQTAIPRHQTLQVTLDWSYNLLSEAEQSLLRSLSVFAGGFTLEAIEAVWAGEIDEFETINILSQLEDKSLVIRTEHDGKSRFRLLETIRQYSLEKARASGELPQLRNRHLDWCLALVQEAQPEMWRPQQATWLNRLETEHDNLRSALGWAQRGESNKVVAEAGLQLASALRSFWLPLGHWSEGRRWLDGALAQSIDASASAAQARARAISGAGLLATAQNDNTRGAALYEECLALSRGIGYKQGIAEALCGLARIARDRGDFAQAMALAEEGLALWRELNHKTGTANALNLLGMVAWRQRDATRSRAFLEEALVIRMEIGDKLNSASLFINLGEIARGQGDHTAARQFYEDGLATFREIKSKGGTASALANLGSIAFQQGDYDSASTFFRESLVLSREIGGRYLIAFCQIGLAGIWARKQPDRAAQLLGSAEAILEAVNSRLETSDQIDYDRNLAAIRAQLDDVAFEKALAEGRAMPMEEAIDLALDIAPALGAGNDKLPGEAYPNDLTVREVELLRLVAAGLRNKEIAGQLTLSKSTVETHLHSIYSKLGVTSRGAAGRFAVEHHLA
jgi:predicted ATPase/DNA-binding NarL/FixJ family response regulator